MTNLLHERMNWNCPSTHECQYLNSSFSRIVDHVPHAVVPAHRDHILVLKIMLAGWSIVGAKFS